MDAKSQSPDQTAAPMNPYFKRLLSICEHYLAIGDYNTCQAFAAKAQISNPNHPSPSQILAICSILIAASSISKHTDWYSILHLPQFTEDRIAIKHNYTHLSNLVNPETNQYPSAAEAREWLNKAFAILSDPKGKVFVDKCLRTEEPNSKKKAETFWTRCPYCSYFYEHEKMYENACLWCQNISCRRSFTASPLPESATPPSDLVNYGVYMSQPAGKDGSNGAQSSGKWLDPLASAFSPSKTKD